MYLKKFNILGLFFLTASAVTEDRVEIKKFLRDFLAALEPYEHARNDVVFLLDESGSIGADKFPQVKLFSELMARQFSVSSERTRVAVVTFSTEPSTHIDNIKDPDGNNLCSLLKEINDIRYAGGYTHTNKAMKAAENILALARPDSNKIIVLLTDGESNGDENPVKIAKKLTSRGIIIFSVGIGDVKEEEIYGVASFPNHAYVLKDFDYIFKVNEYFIKDTYEDSLDLAKDPSHCKFPCDANAKCYCGARTGNYECICNAGYQGMGGFQGQCHQCPKGTYKNNSGNFDCMACPPHSTTLKEGSISFDACRCDTGYEKVGDSCLPMRCAVLSAPEGGVLIPTHCNNTYETQCSFKCNIGFCPFSCKDYPPYSMDNNIGLQKRTCLETGKWSNEEFHCEQMSCPVLSFPHNGMHNCSERDFTYGTSCSFECDKGYELSGPKSRTCSFHGWTGHDVKCKEIHCDKLKSNDLLHVKPVNCSTNSSPYRSVCRYHCKKGYSLVLPGNNTEGVLKCEDDKNWSQAYDKISCKDIEPPKIRCPKSFTAKADPDKDYALVEWDTPNATDNVGIVDVQIIEPIWIKKHAFPHAFPINITKVVYEAKDYSKLTKTCSFNVEVLDEEPPKVLSCPPDIQIYHNEHTSIPVTWEGPKFEDNSKYVTVIGDRKSGDNFGWGPASTVTFTATDPSKNKASCSFSVKVKHYPCPYYDPPANGAVTCDNWNDGRLCSVFCHEGFELAAGKNFHNAFLCNQFKQNGVIVGKWGPFMYTPGFKMPWPDCTRKQNPAVLNTSVKISYSVDFCTEEIVQKMRQKFFYHIKKTLPSILCPLKKGCSAENVNVTCSPTSVRKKRSFDSETHIMIGKSVSKRTNRNKRVIHELPKQVLTISFNMLMLQNATKENPDVKSIDEPFKENDISSNFFLKELQNKISTQVKDIFNMPTVPKPDTKYGITFVCSIGQISVNNSCVNCPVGTYKDDVSESCIPCKTATYQDEERHLSCKPCPVGYTTYQERSKSLNDCKGPCQPGTYSETTFEPCLACPLNTYQERSARKECLKCPPELYTWKVGANASSDCVAPCKPGSFSYTGYEPCILCEIGSFQDKEMQMDCLICPNRTSTTVKGSKYIEDCEEIDICNELHPCQYDSKCIQLDKDYECICSEGLTGKHCEVNADDCESSPCLNNATCVDGISNFTCICPHGWEGHQCETNQDDCKPNPCFNGGECIDKINAYACQCPDGFMGDRCEKNIYECESNPCLNEGTCFDMQNDYRCCCSHDYFGKNCEKKINASICDTVICQNGGTCFPVHDGFSCSCRHEFEGEFCESRKVDKCKEFQCSNGGICVNGNENATCVCPSKFVGLHCEEALLPEFMLSFPTPDTSNYAKVKNDRNLYAITAAFFMRTNFKDSNSRGTPISYSYKFQDHLQDNALTLLNVNNFVLYIHGQSFHTEFSADSDTLWHHYAITWEKMDGKWTFYVDGKNFSSGHAGKGKYMHPGTFILGQEQDDIGGRFSSLEAFAGDITEFNVWDYALTDQEIKRISLSCGYIGNVIPWYIVSQSVYGNVVVSQNVDKCKALGNCPENSCDCFYSDAIDVLSCKHDVKDCIDENTCSYKQPCLTNGERSFCNCSMQFEGRHCEYDVDECLEGNGGCNYICVNDIGTGSYHCECPGDMILSEDGKTCIDTSYCVKDGHIYIHGEEWVDYCQSCICSHGIVLCEEILCNEATCFPEETLIKSPGECCSKCVAWSFCLISPNNTLTSFDMSSYQIEGECTYTAVEDCFDGRFKVQVEPPQNSADNSKLVIYQDCSKLIVSANGSVFSDDKIVSLPFINKEFIVTYSDSTLSVKTTSDLLVQWSFTDEAVIAVPITDVDKMCGICSRIEEHYLYDNGKIPLTERFASQGGTECFITKAFEGNFYRTSGSLSIFPASAIFSVLFITELMCEIIINRLCTIMN